MKKPIYHMRGKVWVYPGMAWWHFVTLPKKQSREIEELFSGVLKRGWGSLRVRVTVGQTSWDTSIFPDKKAGAYLLPLKAEVREKESITHGILLSYSIEIKT